MTGDGGRPKSPRGGRHEARHAGALRLHVDDRDEKPASSTTTGSCAACRCGSSSGRATSRPARRWSSTGWSGPRSTCPWPGCPLACQRCWRPFQARLFQRAIAIRESFTVEVRTRAELDAAFEGGRNALAHGPWCGDAACEAEIKDATRGVTIRAIEDALPGADATCAACGRPAQHGGVLGPRLIECSLWRRRLSSRRSRFPVFTFLLPPKPSLALLAEVLLWRHSRFGALGMPRRQRPEPTVAVASHPPAVPVHPVRWARQIRASDSMVVSPPGRTRRCGARCSPLRRPGAAGEGAGGVHTTIPRRLGAEKAVPSFPGRRRCPSGP